MSSVSLGFTTGSLAIAAVLAGLAMPLLHLGDAWFAFAVFFAPQLGLIGLHYFIPPKTHLSFLAGLSFALLTILLVFATYFFFTPPDSFMVLFIYWIAVGSAAVTSVLFKLCLPHMTRVASSTAAVGVSTYFVTLVGAALLTRLLI